MRRFLFQWLTVALALATAAHMVPGIHVHSVGVLLVAALVLGFVNATVRPVLSLLALPLTVLTLGLFYLVINGAAFALAAYLVPGFGVRNFGSAVMGALVVSVASWFIGWIAGARE